MPRTRICLFSHDFLAGNTHEFDFHRGFLPFVCKNSYADPSEDAEPILGFLTTGCTCPSSSTCMEPPPLTLFTLTGKKKEKVYTSWVRQPGTSGIQHTEVRQHLHKPSLTSHLILPTYNTLIRQEVTALTRCFTQMCLLEVFSLFGFYWGSCVHNYFR